MKGECWPTSTWISQPRSLRSNRAVKYAGSSALGPQHAPITRAKTLLKSDTDSAECDDGPASHRIAASENRRTADS